MLGQERTFANVLKVGPKRLFGTDAHELRRLESLPPLLDQIRVLIVNDVHHALQERTVLPAGRHVVPLRVDLEDAVRERAQRGVREHVR